VYHIWKLKNNVFKENHLTLTFTINKYQDNIKGLQLRNRITLKPGAKIAVFMHSSKVTSLSTK